MIFYALNATVFVIRKCFNSVKIFGDGWERYLQASQEWYCYQHPLQSECKFVLMFSIFQSVMIFDERLLKLFRLVAMFLSPLQMLCFQTNGCLPSVPNDP